MLPSNRIHVNPKFKSAHINPNFLLKQNDIAPKQPQIHINPKFIRPSPIVESTHNILAPPKASLIQKTLRKIVRKHDPIQKPVPIKIDKCVDKFTKIGKNKLVRVKKSPDIVKTQLKNLNKTTDRTIIKRHFLCRSSILTRNVKINSILKVSSKINGSYNNSLKTSKNKKLEFLNINGILYKSTSRKLEKSSSSSSIIKPNPGIIPKISIKSPGNKSGRLIYVRGEKFMLDSSNKSLKRLDSQTQFKKTRIDIGGLTYVAKNDGSTYEQTSFHRIRSHLSIARNKSINVLSKKYVKSNIPCPIYRRLGKCLGYERGRCNRVHDRKHVIICSKHIKGECLADKCLLSHEINLSKMPTCKFFLQGCCSKTNCPYLHKKLNDNVDVCENFLKGFCDLADKCPKRHELKRGESSTIDQICPWLGKQGACLDKNCKYQHIVNEKSIKGTINPRNTKTDSEIIRYFISNDIGSAFSTASDSKTGKNNVIRDRSSLSNLPAYIPL